VPKNWVFQMGARSKKPHCRQTRDGRTEEASGCERSRLLAALKVPC
jgi:hypothetical protein